MEEEEFTHAVISNQNSLLTQKQSGFHQADTKTKMAPCHAAHLHREHPQTPNDRSSPGGQPDLGLTRC